MNYIERKMYKYMKSHMKKRFKQNIQDTKNKILFKIGKGKNKLFKKKKK